MTPYVTVFNLLAAKPMVHKSEVQAALCRSQSTSDKLLAQLCERGDIRRIARGVYALPGTPNLAKGRG